MPISFYNTLSRTIEKFVPLTEGKVTMYTCGPTVYNYFHIGNARSFVMSDVIRRYLEYRGYDVTYVMNLTDIDDRIIKQSIEENIPASSVSLKYTEAFFEDIRRLAIRKATVYPKATESIADIVAFIDKLVQEGAAYEVDGDVYFSVDAFPDYGKLSGKKLDELQVGARVEEDKRKRNPLDFALWKSAKPGEPTWDAPWSKGRPGWHIECSVMSQKYLGTTFDIHAGGNDLIFPHHENEIAQSEACSHQPFARYWIHFGFLNIDNEKMSKSLGNFFTARDVLDTFSAAAIRFFYFQTHYRSPLNYSIEALEGAQKGIEKLQTLYASLPDNPDGTTVLDCAPFIARFEEAMDDDFNTPAAFGALFDLVRTANSALNSGAGLHPDSRTAVQGFIKIAAGDVFGVLDAQDNNETTSEEYSKLMAFVISIRAKARAEKQWQLSDYIRDGLKEIGLQLEDTKSGTSWKRLK
jgi:cysteinyl-tRNA synthetase